MKKAFSIIWNTFFFSILLVLGGLFFLPMLPIDGNIQVKIVQSGSMEPAIMTGGIVVVKPSGEYRIGDVVTFAENPASVPTTHRIVALQNEGRGLRYVTKGDANEEADAETAAKGDVIGKVIFDAPYAGFVLDFARKPLGFALLIVLPALMIVLDEIEKIWKEYRRLRQSKKTGVIPVTRVSKAAVSKETATVDASVVKNIQARPMLPSRAMDIRPPVRPLVVTRLKITPVPSEKPKTKKNADWAIASSIALLFSGAVFCVGMIGTTISYFSDIEAALANTLDAISVDFTVAGDESAFAFVDNEGSVMSVVAPQSGSADMLYTVRAEKMSGIDGFCNALTAEVVAPPFSYPEGLLLSLSGTNVDFIGPWTLDIGLATGTYAGGDQCVVDIVYTGHHIDASGTGYSDEERQTLTFTAPGIAPFIQSFFAPQASEEEGLGSTTPETVPEEDPEENTGTSTEEIPPVETIPEENTEGETPIEEETSPEETEEGAEAESIPEPEEEPEPEPQLEPEEEPEEEPEPEPEPTI